MPKRTKKEALERLGRARASTGRAPLKGRLKSVHDLAYMGAAGLIMLDPLNRLADERIVLPLDMIAIPAFELPMLYQGKSPSMQIYIRAGETILPTGGNVRDVEEALLEVTADDPTEELAIVKRKPATAYQKRYKKEFAKAAPNYKRKDGTWKKNGFKRCVKEAHYNASKGKK